MFAALPMYDWPGVRAATDALWDAIREELRAVGLPAPQVLARPFNEADWLRPDLTLAQTCGMPFRLWLHDKVTLLGAADYGVEGCPPGYYCSFIVTQKGRDPKGKAAVSALHSQSGYAALAAPKRFILTGSHEASIRAVAIGQADYAAIDAVTWMHACREMAETGGLHIHSSTKPTPGLPFITANRDETETMQLCIEAAISRLSRQHKTALFLHGFVRFKPSDYL
jgi:ABC-type phosphate/phosphonate transport system substrate-binding protein